VPSVKTTVVAPVAGRPQQPDNRRQACFAWCRQSFSSPSARCFWCRLGAQAERRWTSQQRGRRAIRGLRRARRSSPSGSCRAKPCRLARAADASRQRRQGLARRAVARDRPPGCDRPRQEVGDISGRRPACLAHATEHPVLTDHNGQSPGLALLRYNQSRYGCAFKVIHVFDIMLKFVDGRDCARP
jgi:hypothetical protein